MDEERTRTPEVPKPELKPEIRQRLPFSWLAWPCAVFILYLLSIGPMARYYRARTVPQSVETFYAPLVYLGNNATPVRQFMLWYVDGLWLGGKPSPPPPPAAPITNAPPVSQ